MVDEVQRLPAILNSVQDLIARHGQRRYRFALTGSSARKLKRGGANLLPGRVVNRPFFPLTAAELGHDFRRKSHRPNYAHRRDYRVPSAHRDG